MNSRMEKLEFMPVILGTDENAYGMAKSFHMQYGVTSLAIGQAELYPIKNSKIISVEIRKDFSDPEIFVEKLIEVAEKLKPKAKKLILIACGDNYAKNIIKGKKYLKDHYIMPYVDEDLMNQLIYKENFYKTCHKYNLDYPKTEICTPKTRDNIKIPFEFPVIIKASDDVLYRDCSFEGKKKVYIAEDKQELTNIINLIYSSKYNKNLIVQEYIPNDGSSLRVLNCYSGKDKKVKMMCLGQPLLEDHSPTLIGNYTAIINKYDEGIYNRFKDFLEDLGYTGFSNFDMRLDPRDGKFKVFEINFRPGRSSFFVTGSGYNLSKYIVEDYIYDNLQEPVLADNEHLWLGMPKTVLLKYLDDQSLELYVKELIKQNKSCNTLYYKKDVSLHRLITNILYYRDYRKRYDKYYSRTLVTPSFEISATKVPGESYDSEN